MNRVVTTSLVVVVVMGLSTQSRAAGLFADDPFFSIAPYSQMGTMTGGLNINNLNLGYMIAGQVQISVPAGVVTGTLLEYQVKRKLDPTFGSASIYLKQYIVGFSLPTAGGTFGPTSGYCKTYFDFTGYPANTPLSLTNGAATWNVNQSGFLWNYTSGTDIYMVQDFILDGSKLSGPAGTWIVDLPVISLALPEPASLTVMGLGLMVLCRRRRTAA